MAEPGTLLGEVQLGLKRFWGLQWRFKGSALAVLAVVSIAAFGGGSDKSTPNPNLSATRESAAQVVEQATTASSDAAVASAPATTAPSGLIQSDAAPSPTAAPTIAPTATRPAPTATAVPPTPVPARAAPTATQALAGIRTGAICKDGTSSTATGSGACSHHGGVAYWTYR